MLLAPLPFDYLEHLGRDRRTRPSRNRPSEGRVRRGLRWVDDRT
jgi:hypothetical protein